MRYLARWAMLVMGVFWIDSSTASLRRTGPASSKMHRLKSGDLIVANHQSYLDILYLYFRYGACFTEMDRAGNLWLVSVPRALSAGCGLLIREIQGQPLATTCQQARAKNLGPVVVFPEATTSNGRGLLKFHSIFQTSTRFPKDTLLQIITFQYPFTLFSPTFSAGSGYVHLFRLCSQFQNAMQVRTLASTECPLLDPQSADLLVETANLTSRLTRLRKTGQGWQEKQHFLSFYQQRA